MLEKPLLIFPSPSSIGRYKLTGGSDKQFNYPTKQQQIERIQPLLDVLERTMQERQATLQPDAVGVDPEMVLVFETRGHVQDFFKAVRRIEDLEWLGEMEKDFDPDGLFFYENDEKQIKGKLYFILTNQKALKKILQLWSNYKRERKFDWGMNKWRDLFALLYDVRLWSVQDRISETGILEDWGFRIQNEEEKMPFELELWFRKTQELRGEAVVKIQNLLDQFDGEIISESVIEEIAYHGLLIKAPIQIFNTLTEQTEIDFFKASDIMFLRPVGQCAIKISEQTEAVEIPAQEQPSELSNPIIALLDGLPLQNHTLLSNRLTVDDPDNYSQGYLASARFHGTGMCSVIIHGDKSESNIPIKSRLYVRPIMKRARTFKGDVELIPEDVLIVDLVHRSVRRLFEKEGDNDPVAPSIKIINLSVGDPYRVFDNIMSSWAKLLDWLSFKYKLLFIVSAGNCHDDLDYSQLQNQFPFLITSPNDLKKESLKAIYNNNRYRKIISPGESINAITVGASDYDGLPFQPTNNRVMLFNSPSYPSPLSRMGLGYKRSIKPDIIVPGGRALYRQKAGQPILSLVESRSEPGIKVAAPSPNNSLTGTVYSIGTSNSAALLSHLSAKLYESFLESEFESEITEGLFALIAKSLIIHSSSWDESFPQEIINSINLQNSNPRDLVTRFLGYGSLTPNRIFECTDKRVTLIGYGSLAAEHAHLFKLPIPVAISGSTLWRSLTATLAWFSPTNSLNQAYRQAKLWFDFPDKAHSKILSVARKFYDNDTVNRGTVQHEIFEGVKASAFLEGTELPIRVNCKEDAPGMLKDQKINYVISVTLEVHPSLQADIYNDVRVRIRPRIPVR